MYHTWIPEDIERAADVIKTGGLILYPTDTIWGIGCNATNPDAILKVSKLKNRPPGKSFVILVSSIEMLKSYAHDIHPRIETLLEYHKQPLTIIYPHTTSLPEELKAPDGSIAIRVTMDSFCQQLIEQLGYPLLSTSANLAGYPPANTFGEISSYFITAVNYVCKHRQGSKEYKAPSVIATFDRSGAIDIIRE